MCIRDSFQRGRLALGACRQLVVTARHVADAVVNRPAAGAYAVHGTGQASLHHGHLIHASGPNTTNDRRIGAAIRYISTSMRQKTQDRTLVALVNGEDRYGHFTIAGSPRGRLNEADFEMCRQDARIRRRVLYEGVDPARGNRY